MEEVEMKAAADRLEAEYAQQLLAEALRRKSETDFEHHVSLCTPPPKVLSPAGGSGLSRRCTILADNDTSSLSAAGIALAFVQQMVRVHFWPCFISRH